MSGLAEQSPTPRFQPAGYRRAVLQALLALTVICGAVFIVINLRIGNLPLAMAEAGMGLYALVLMLVVKRTRRLERLALAYLLPFCTVMMFALASPLTGSSVFIWVLLIPVVSHLLLGRWLGGALALAYLVIAAGIFVWRHGTNSVESQSIEVIANILLAALCIFVFSHIHEYSRERADRALLRLAMADPLTGLANRARFLDRTAAEQARHARKGTPFAVLIVDLDFFKQVNDSHGHAVGDIVLRTIADVIRRQVGSEDLAARLGGEEFAVLLVDCDRRDARARADRLCRSIADTHTRHGSDAIRVTASIGIGCVDVDGNEFDSLFSAADARLYQAKAGGRNRVVA
ncbi:GGDEF domain-containing protein [Salinisphaera sp. T31B1]|uniref:GGDEF domain-containing protein n=1 Tax=Salinisphaera sp. T31B1 TaxID=727963 RepID=UPI00333F81EC